MAEEQLPVGVRRTEFGYKARGVPGLFSHSADAYAAFVEASAAKRLERREFADECRALLSTVDPTWATLSDRDLMQRIFDTIAKEKTSHA